MDKVSVVVPIYNMGDKIEICVQSLTNQTYRNIEIILVDDGSKDDSFERCQRLAANDSRIVAIHTENRGSGPARNTGIENASGRYVYFPDADDYLDPKAIEILVDAIKVDDCDLVVFGFRSVNQKGKEIWVKKYNGTVRGGDEIRSAYVPYMTTSSEYGIQGAPWNKFFDMNVIRKYTLEYPPLRRHQDEGFIARYMCYAKRVRFIEDVLYTYYINDLQKEWQKYPVDYIDAVIGLYETRKETILTWNKDDTATRDMIVKEYINNVIKAMELSFSPKMNFNKAQRKEWIVSAIAKSKIETIDRPDCVGRYQSIILSLLKKKRLRALYCALHYKTAIQKNEKLYNFLRGR